MTNKKLALSLLVSCVMLPGFAAAQAVYGNTSDAKIEKFNAKIARTAEALGVSVYEDYPVQAGGSASASNSAVPAVSAPARAAARYQVPALSEPKADVPQNFAAGESTSYTGTAVTIWHAVAQQVGDLIPGSGAPSFEEISDRVRNASVSRAYPARQAGQPSLFTDPGFVSEFERATGARFSEGNYAHFLIDGENSFAAKDSLIKNAKKSIFVSSWAFYDDTTGYEAAQMLIAKKQQGLDVKVMIDSMVSNSHGIKVVKMMKKAGIEIVMHTDADRYSDIWHVKSMVIDDQYAITGGMNFGDVYSHKGNGSIKWRDTDVLYSGPAVAATKALLGAEWNAQVKAKGLGFGLVDTGSRGEYESGAARVAVVLENPPVDSPILISIVKAMYGATRNINIENAYFVAIPVVTQAVLDARARGVEVTILTNSKESIDAEGKPIVDAMNKCLIPLVQSGARIYLKQGAEQTLHSKFMTVDGEFASLGSYNLHPRGERSDSEMNVNLMGRDTVAELDAAFSRDIAAARPASVQDLQAKPGLVSQIMSSWFYAHLGAEVPGAAGLASGN